MIGWCLIALLLIGCQIGCRVRNPMILGVVLCFGDYWAVAGKEELLFDFGT